MKVVTVSYLRSSTLNVGDFESVRIEVGAVAEVEDGESVSDVYDALREKVGEELTHDAREVRAKTRRRQQQDR